jgi:tetratricopeptide (TPR) repeat protein
MSDTPAPLTENTAKSALNEAIVAIQNNDAIRAEGALDRLLAADPGNADALQLLGMLRRSQNRLPEAEDLYRRSLASNPAQPQVHHNLGNLLRMMGRQPEALASLREAVRLKPNYAEAHLGLGLVQHDLKMHTDAEKSYREALRFQPNFLAVKQSLGGLLNDMGRPKEGEAVLKSALAAGPRDPRQAAALEHNLGISMSRQDRHDIALALFDSAQAKAPDMPMVDYNRGNALQKLGHLDAAVRSYQKAVARNPLDTEAHSDLNHLLYRLGDDENFLRSFDEAMELYPNVGGLPLSKATFLFYKEDFARAREAFERAARFLPDDVAPHDGMGLILAREGHFASAIQSHEKAVAMEPDNAHAWRNFSETLLRAGDPERARDAVEKSLAIEPEHQGALALLGTSLDLLGDSQGEALNDYENFVQVFEIAPPEGYSDIESFNRDLDHYLGNLHRDKRENVDQTLRGGTQTMDNLFGHKHDLAERLRARVDEAVAIYIERMREDEKHPLLRRRKRDFGYAASWSSRLRDCGFHTNHYHPKGWISSAYYVAVPEAVEDTAAQQGWIKFGEPAFDAGLKKPIRRTVQPQVGRLVLFPSYMWHGTVPFHSSKDRTTVAFDVVPT